MSLDKFLDGLEPEEAPAPLPAAPEPPPVESAPPEGRAEPEAPVPHDDDEVEPAQGPDGVVPVSKFILTRQQRNDYKGRADRLEGELAAKNARLEELERRIAAPPPPPPPAPVVQAAPPPAPIPPMPNVYEDPEGFRQWTLDRQAETDRKIEQKMFAARIDMDDGWLRDRIGDDAKVDAALDRFKAEAAVNPAMRIPMNAPNPVKWAYDMGRRLAAQDEIGADPDAWKASREAELRAKWEAEMLAGGNPQPAVPRPVLPTSLTNARSAAPRGAVPIEDESPVDMGELFRDVRKSAVNRNRALN